MTYQHIDQDMLGKVFESALSLGASRSVLLTGIDPRITASLPVFASPASTIWSDLNQLNQLAPLEDGSIPLASWLKNAKLVAGPRREARVFQEAIALVLSRGQANRTVPPEDVLLGEPRDDMRGGPDKRPPNGDSGERGFRGGPLETADIVILHHPDDEAFASELNVHAATLARADRVRIWSSSAMLAGAVHQALIARMVASARIVVVLLSASFLGSDKMDLALSALRSGKRVVPILARACDWTATELGRLAALPANGVPIAQQSSPDAAYVQIVGALRDLLSRIPRSTVPISPVAPTVERPPSQTVLVREVFAADGPPELTYVAPAEHADLLEALGLPDKGLVVEGASSIGKTTSVLRALRELGKEVKHLFPDDPETQKIAGPGDVKGWVVIDDFHKLDPACQARLAQVMKWMLDRKTGDRKLVIIGVGEVARSVVSRSRDLVNRFDRVRIVRQPNPKVEKLLELGEQALNIELVPRDVITSLACGSFALAQMLAACAVKQARVTKTASKKVQVPVERGVLVGSMLQDLRLLYTDPLLDLLRSSQPVRGFYLALFWRLSKAEDEGMHLTAVGNTYRSLEPAVRTASKEILAPLQTTAPWTESIQVDQQRITVVDPRLSFFLRNESFIELCRDAGLDDVARINNEGELELFGPDHEVIRPGVGTARMWDVRDMDLFWGRTDVRRLHKILEEGYGIRIQALTAVAVHAMIPAAAVAFQGRAVKDVARDILDEAWRRGLIKKLLLALLADDSIGTFHSEIRAMLSDNGDAG